MAPKLFGEVFVAETPATDPKTLLGRTVDVNLADISNQQSRFFVKLQFQVVGVNGKNASTEFAGYSVIREQVARFVRKRSQKVELILPLVTKDGWELQATAVAVLARKTKTEIERSVRHYMATALTAAVKKETIDSLVKSVVTGGLQTAVKQAGNKVYPLKYFELAKIEVHGAPWMSVIKPAKAAPAEAEAAEPAVPELAAEAPAEAAQ